MIEIRSLSKRYGRRIALDDVSLRIEPGDVTLLLGANGAGKSTLLRCLLGITGFEGSIAVTGLEPLSNGPALRSLIGYMPQAGGLHPHLTVRETLRMYADIRRVPRERCAALIAEAGLAGHADACVGELSGGQRQRLGFAVALLTDPPILILDEPGASLDAAGREWLTRRLGAMATDGRIVLVSTHAGQDLLESGSRQITLEEGRVVSDRRLRPAACGASNVETAAAPRPGSVAPIASRELQDAIGNRWLAGYAAVLAILGLAAAATGIESSSGLALQAFGRTTATLMNLCLLLAPLVGVLVGGATIAGERDRGTLEHLLAQPVGRTALLLAKHAGVLGSLTVATIVGFLPAGLLIGWHAGPAMLAHYAVFPLLASLVAAAMAAIGLLISVASRTAVQAQGAGMVAWFMFVLLYDLVLMGSLALTGLPVQLLAAALVANPVDAGRVLGVLALESDLYLLGPAGAYLTTRAGSAGTALLLLGSILLWAVLPLMSAAAGFRLRRPRPARAVTGRRASLSAYESTVASISRRRPSAKKEVRVS